MAADDKISVIMGVYNCANTLPMAIESILAQTYSNWELIMCDDASTDNTYAVANQFRERYPERIILLKNEKNSKLAFSLNRCIEAASGRYIARMDADDKCAPDRFQKQVEYLQQHPDIQLVGTAMQRFNEKGLGVVDRKPAHPDRYSLRDYIPFNHATIMTYKYVYERLHGYTVCERTVRGQDYDLWFRFFYEGFRGDNIQEPLYYVLEDEAAFKRRTFKVRWYGFQTTCVGYKLLDYPKWWIIKPCISFVIKSILPKRVLMFLHRLPKREKI